MAPHGRAYMEIPESTGISAVQPEFWNFRAESARRGARPAAGAVILEYPKFSAAPAGRRLLHALDKTSRHQCCSDLSA
jgi:hypothetical protein